jgi:hypothetical protein
MPLAGTSLPPVILYDRKTGRATRLDGKFAFIIVTLSVTLID